MEVISDKAVKVLVADESYCLIAFSRATVLLAPECGFEPLVVVRSEWKSESFVAVAFDSLCISRLEFWLNKHEKCNRLLSFRACFRRVAYSL